MRCKNLKVLFNNTYSDSYIKENVAEVLAKVTYLFLTWNKY